MLSSDFAWYSHLENLLRVARTNVHCYDYVMRQVTLTWRSLPAGCGFSSSDKCERATVSFFKGKKINICINLNRASLRKSRKLIVWGPFRVLSTNAFACNPMFSNSEFSLANLQENAFVICKPMFLLLLIDNLRNLKWRRLIRLGSQYWVAEQQRNQQ